MLSIFRYFMVVKVTENFMNSQKISLVTPEICLYIHMILGVAQQPFIYCIPYISNNLADLKFEFELNIISMKIFVIGWMNCELVVIGSWYFVGQNLFLTMHLYLLDLPNLLV